MQEKKDKSSVKKPIYKKWWFWVIIVVVLSAIFGNMGSNDENKPEQAESHIYDNAQVKDVMNGSRTVRGCTAFSPDWQSDVFLHSWKSWK